MKLNELAMSPESLKAIQNLIIARVTNMGTAVRNGASTTHCLMAEICVLEAKVDALMMMLETGGMDFTPFNDFLLSSAKSGTATAVNLSHMMNKTKK